ncbi:DUF1289 domain-containing protein, partial [Xanthomonas sp. Kuri4-1]
MQATTDDAEARAAMRSPCLGVCSLDGARRCVGCLRTIDEIARWKSMSDTERDTYLQTVLPARAASSAASPSA